MPNKRFDKTNRLQQAFNQSKSPKFPLPLNKKILHGYLVITGQLVISGGTTNGVASGEGGPINLVKRVRVRTSAADSRYFDGLVVDCAPRSLLRYAITQRNGGKFLGELSGSTLSSGAAGTYTIYLAIPIFWADSNLRNQKATALNSDAYKSIVVEADLGVNTDCFTGTDRAWDTSGLVVQWIDYREEMQGDTYVLIQQDNDHAIAGASKRTLVPELPSKEGVFLQLLLMTESGVATQTLVDTIFNRLTLSAVNLDFDLYANDIRQKMFDDGWYDPSQSATGQYLIDFTDGSIGGNIPAPGLIATFDLSNPGGAGLDNLKVFSKRLVAPDQYKPAA